MTPKDNSATEQLRASITKLVTDMTVDKTLSEEFLIDKLIELIEQKTLEARIDEIDMLCQSTKLLNNGFYGIPTRQLAARITELTSTNEKDKAL